MKKAAFFDFSYTLFHGSIALAYVSFLKDQGHMSGKYYLKFQKIVDDYLSKRINYEKTVTLAHKYFVNFLRGQSLHRHEILVAKFLNQNKHLFYPFSKKLVKFFKERVCLIILVTADLDFIVKEFAYFLTIDYLISSKFELKNDVFTGQISTSLDKREKKLKAIKSFIANKNIDLKSSWAFGDADADIEMLKLVGHSVAFNPREGLKEYAVKNKWLICNEKNVLKKIKPFLP